MSNLEQVCDDIVTMRTRGAAKIGRAAAQALVDVAKEYDGADFYNEIIAAAKKLKGTRPTAVFPTPIKLGDLCLGTDAKKIKHPEEAGKGRGSHSQGS